MCAENTAQCQDDLFIYVTNEEKKNIANFTLFWIRSELEGGNLRHAKLQNMKRSSIHTSKSIAQKIAWTPSILLHNHIQQGPYSNQ
jgi:hypothetical protein